MVHVFPLFLHHEIPHVEPAFESQPQKNAVFLRNDRAPDPFSWLPNDSVESEQIVEITRGDFLPGV